MLFRVLRVFLKKIDKFGGCVYNVCMKKRLNITLDEKIVPLVDDFADKNMMNRSVLIQLALQDYMRRNKLRNKNLKK